MKLSNFITIKKQTKDLISVSSVLTIAGYKKTGRELFELWKDAVKCEDGCFAGSVKEWEKEGKKFVFASWTEKGDGLNICEVIS
jgi:hypothetical protein